MSAAEEPEADPHKFAEMQVLALVLDPEARALIRSRIEPAWIRDTLRRVAFEAAMQWDREHPEPLTYAGWVLEVARRSEQPPQGVGVALCECLYWPGKLGNLDGYARIMREAWERREIGVVAQTAHAEAQDPTRRPEEIAGRMQSIGEVLRARLPEIMTGAEAVEIAESRAGSVRVATGFSKIDRHLGGGLMPSELCVVAGRTSMGKSSFAIDVTRNALRNGQPVGYVTLEMPPEQIEQRLRAVPYPAELPLRLFSPRGACSVDAILAGCQRIAEYGLALVVVDHVQLVKAVSGRSRYEAMTEVSHAMKALAKQLDVPVIALSQLSRKAAEGNDPQLDDLRDSGALEEDADQVILLHRPGYYDATKDQTEAWANLAKNRNGETGKCRLYWDAPRASFAEYAPSNWDGGIRFPGDFPLTQRDAKRNIETRG